MDELSDQELLDALGVDTTPAKVTQYSPREERIIAGFEDIQRFVTQQQRLPQADATADIFERLYAVRLARLQQLPEAQTVLQALDTQGLLTNTFAAEPSPVADLDDAALLSALGVARPAADDITQLQHVQSRAESRAVAEEIANRTPCKGFAKQFKALFKQVQTELEQGLRTTAAFGGNGNSEINQGDWFILSGQKVYVADMGEVFTADYGRLDARLRVIYDNATESDLLMRSLQRALHKDATSRRILELSPGPLFADQAGAQEVASGTIYVLRSLSDHPSLQAQREVIHKIGVTSGNVKTRVANAKLDATFLMAEVEIMATYQLFNIHPIKLEQLIHKFFDQARLEIEILDRFGHPVNPREWFFVPLPVIDAVVEKIRAGTLSRYCYDRYNMVLVEKAY